MIGAYIPGDSLIYRLEARTKIICLLLLLAAVFSSYPVWGYCFIFCVVLGIAWLSKLPMRMIFGAIRRLWLFFIFCVVLGIAWLSKLPMRNIFGAIRRLWLFFIFIFFMNALFFEGTQILFCWRFIRVSAEGVNQGFLIAANVFLIMVLSNVLTGTTTPVDITSALGSLLKPFKIVGVPTEEVAMILSVAMQFVPTLLAEAQSIQKAQTARGARFESKNLKERIGSFFPLLIPIFLAAFRRADELSTAMEARGYKNAKNRTKKAAKPLLLQDYGALFICSLLCGLQIYLKIRLGGN